MRCASPATISINCALMFPLRAVVVIQRFIQQSLDVENPGAFLMVRGSDPHPNQLVFSIFREDYPSDQEYLTCARLSFLVLAKELSDHRQSIFVGFVSELYTAVRLILAFALLL